MIKIGDFPQIVNENAARIVALQVLILAIAIIFTESIVLNLFLLYGFIARVLYGPRFDLFAKVTLRFIIPAMKIGYIATPGIPKRFAQLIGLIFGITSVILLYFGCIVEFKVTLVILSFFAFLESIFGFCAGCFVFGILMKIGVIPNEVCERCSNISYDI